MIGANCNFYNNHKEISHVSPGCPEGSFLSGFANRNSITNKINLLNRKLNFLATNSATIYEGQFTHNDYRKSQTLPSEIQTAN